MSSCSKLASSQNRLKFTLCSRAALSNSSDGNESTSPDGEDFSIEEAATLGPKSGGGASETPSSATTSTTANQLTQEQLLEVLGTLSQSLAVLSSSLSEVSSAVRVLSAALSTQEQRDPNSFVSASVTSDRDYDTASRENNFVLDEVPEPWDVQKIPDSLSENVDNLVARSLLPDDSVPANLVEQNRRAHKLAYKLQQTFIQARIEGLGKPFQVAVEEFVDTCLEAHSIGIGLKELQLQLILQDGALPEAFAIRNQKFSNDPIVNEETRIRSLWIRLVYATIAELEEMEKPAQPEEITEEKEPLELDGTDTFVKQVIKLCVESGYDLARIKLEQNFAGAPTSPSIKAMRQNQYLILLVVHKIQNRMESS